MAEPNKAKIQEILASNLDPAEKLRLIVEEQRIVDKENVREAVAMLTPEEREELNRRAREGEVVVPGGTGGKSLEAQIHLAEGRAKGGKHRAKQLGKEGYQEMGKKGGLSSSGESPEEKGVPIDESKFGPRAEEKHIAIRYLTGFQHGQMMSNQYFNQEQTEAESLTISNVQNDTTRHKHQKSLTIANCTYEAYKLYLY